MKKVFGLMMVLSLLFAFTSWAGNTVTIDGVVKDGLTITIISGTPTPPICTSFTYSAWSLECINGVRTRTVTSANPAGCVGGSPILTQPCIDKEDGSKEKPFKLNVPRTGSVGYSLSQSGAFAAPVGKRYFAVDPLGYTGVSRNYFRMVVASPGQNPLRFWYLVKDKATGAILLEETYLGYYELAKTFFNSPYLIDSVIYVFVIENYGTKVVGTTIWWQ